MCLSAMKRRVRLKEDIQVFKVVRTEGSKMKSCYPPKKREAQVSDCGRDKEYKQGKTHTARFDKSFGMYVFLRSDDAKRYAMGLVGRAVLNCIVPKGTGIRYGFGTNGIRAAVVEKLKVL